MGIRMAHTFSNLLVHIIFSTKNRRPQITQPILPRLHAYLGGILKEERCIPLSIGGKNDHVHILVAIPPVLAIADLLRIAKTNSSRWVHETWPDAPFAWQEGYGAFSVSKSNSQAVIRYIEQQEEHHRKLTFQEEFIAFLERHQVPYDERWIWE